MTSLPLTYAPHPIFKQVATPVTEFDDELRELVSDMFETLEVERGVGMAAPMVGIDRRIAIVDLHENGKSNPIILINPEVTVASKDTQTHEEASLCFLGISANVTRPHAITVRYQDTQGEAREMHAEGYLAQVIQHEIDYLNGTVFLDYLSKLKRDTLIKKMQKYMKANPPAVATRCCDDTACCG